MGSECCLLPAASGKRGWHQDGKLQLLPDAGSMARHLAEDAFSNVRKSLLQSIVLRSS